MAQQAAMTVNTRGTANGAATNTVTYNPVFAGIQTPTKDGSLVAKWQERTAAYSIGYSDLTVVSRPAMGGQSLQTMSLKLVIPTLDVTSPATGTGIQPAPSVAYNTEVKVEAKLPTRGAVAERWEIHARAVSAFSNAVILALFKDNEQIN